jgi:hypothetical protein
MFTNHRLYFVKGETPPTKENMQKVYDKAEIIY